MTASEAELTLVLKARNLADKAMTDLKDGLNRIKTAASKVAGAFKTATAGMSSGFRFFVEDLARGEAFGPAMVQLGAFMAFTLVENMGAKLVEKIGASAFVQGLAATLGGLGTAIGGFIAAAVPVGMALLPVLLLAALAAAIIYLTNNPKIIQNVGKVAGDIVKFLIDGLAGLAGKILGSVVSTAGEITRVVGGFVGDIVTWFLGIPGKLVSLGGNIIKSIIDGLATFPTKLAKKISSAFSGLHINVGPFHITGKGVTIDLPKITLPGTGNTYNQGTYDPNAKGKGHAAGGWVGLNGPEIGLLGEKGPEYMIPNHDLNNRGSLPVVSGVTIHGVTQREILDMVDRGMYFRLQRAAPSRDI